MSERRKMIKCSQCDQTFYTGFDYRIHWELHLNKFIEEEKNKNNLIK